MFKFEFKQKMISHVGRQGLQHKNIMINNIKKYKTQNKYTKTFPGIQEVTPHAR